MNASRTTTRRQLIGRAAAAGTAFAVLPDWIAAMAQASPALAAASTGRLTPELTEGPYWVDTALRRSDVRANTSGAETAPGVAQDGVSLKLTIKVLESGKPLSGVAVDIWHANARGLYSDESSQAAGGGAGGGDTSGQNYLRGYQITGRDRGINAAPLAGQVSFETIWPGWYTGRAIHIHVRVRKLSEHGATIAGYTTQIFFSDADNDAVVSGAAPYNTRSPKTIRAPTRATRSCAAPMSRQTSSSWPAISAMASRPPSTSNSTMPRWSHPEASLAPTPVVRRPAPSATFSFASAAGIRRDAQPGCKRKKPSKTGSLRNCGTGTRTPNFCSRGRRVADYTIPQGVATGRVRRSAWPRSEAIIGRRSSRLRPGALAGAAVARPSRPGLNTATAVAHAAAAACDQSR